MGFFSDFGGSLISGAASLIGAGLGAYGQHSANQLSMDEAALNRQFQMDFYKNRYQWQMADMRKAGLNPILAYKQGAPGGASGSMAQIGNIFGRTGDNLSSGVQSAIASRRLTQELRNMKATNNLLDAQLGKTTWERNLIEQQHNSAKAEATRNRKLEQIYNTRLGEKVLRAGLVNREFGWSAGSLGETFRNIKELTDAFINQTIQSGNERGRKARPPRAVKNPGSRPPSEAPTSWPSKPYSGKWFDQDIHRR